MKRLWRLNGTPEERQSVKDGTEQESSLSFSTVWRPAQWQHGVVTELQCNWNSM